ncbi:glycosyltransferase [Tunturiibacter gelidiferens]|uniref:glycosyltransferase n=1 Tax=Tunturiibacter gelidiferens TaxID=3069689 RepID=UPI003D9AD324
MTQAFHYTLTLSAWLIALAWLWKALTAALGLRRIPDLTAPEHNLTPPNNPSITVIVPARNEEKHIGACLNSLLQQDYTNLHIIAVDDRSSDNTASSINALATQHPDRLTALHITELPRNG